MQDRQVCDRLAITIERDDDGVVDVELYVEELHHLVDHSVRRRYPAGWPMEEVTDDVCRLLCGWGSWGLMGLDEVAAKLVQS